MDVAGAYSITQVTNLAELNREYTYRMLSAKGKPKIPSVVDLGEAALAAQTVILIQNRGILLLFGSWQ